MGFFPQKNEYFWGMTKLWILFGGHHKAQLFGGILYISGLFIRSRYRIGIILGGCKISNVFGGD